MKDFEKLDKLSYKQLAQLYNKYFSLGNLGGNINLKFALISLLGNIVTQLKKKNPDVTYYEILNKIATGTGAPDEFIQVVAIIAEDFAYNCTDFPTFDLKPKEMITKIKEILNMYLPF